MGAEPPRQPSSYPFTKSTADVIMRTSDGVDFKVHRLILSEASPFFEGMFALPQPPPTPNNDVDTHTSLASPTTTTSSNDGNNAPTSRQDDLPVILVTEPSEIIDALLRLCYPFSPPVFATVDAIAAVLEAARKYALDGVVARVAFAAAWHLRLHTEAAAAARGTLRHRAPISSWDKEISLDAVFLLMEYRARCVAAAIEFVRCTDQWGLFRGLGSGDGESCADHDSKGRFMTLSCERCQHIQPPQISHLTCCSKWQRIQIDVHEFQDVLAKSVVHLPCGATVVENRILHVQLMEEGSYIACTQCKVDAIDMLNYALKQMCKSLDAVLAKLPLKLPW
ncbi:uncharacterized protein FIBRA_04621 [Fibroporia radiculosa]|uniref:BTB domain-containing protein n=1 Tax=Fibroporia radiculosa TaxID=599839 RepID=J4H322_9APHY|nr:uncharacterized protein FIBRA_04621 [Fibroporia radiculosa]CCM02519.1 predicted protein [Fibroporia radiculosa]